MIDNTFATPYLCRPFEWGANIVVHSTTKFLGGHGTTIGGVIVDGGNFDWTSGRFANFTTPDPSYHGLVYADLGAPAFILKARVQILRDIGACQAPFNSWQTIQGIETLSLRMDRHVANAQAVAEFLDGASAGELGQLSRAWPAIPITSGPRSICPRAPGAILGFGIKGGVAAGQQVHREPASSSATWPTSATPRAWPSIRPRTTHSQLSEDELATAGVTPDFIRLSVGLEDIDDILWDLDQALEASAA